MLTNFPGICRRLPRIPDLLYNHLKEGEKRPVSAQMRKSTMKTEPIAATGKSPDATVLELRARSLIGATQFAALLLAALLVLAPGLVWAVSFLERAQQYYEEGDLRSAAVDHRKSRAC